MNYRFKFDILPQVKERPRFARRGKLVITMTAPKTRAFEDALGLLAVNQMKGKTMLDGPLTVGLVFEFKRPKKTKLHSPRKDLDNLIKSTLDACNGIVYKDDTSIWALHAAKRWADQDRIFIEVEQQAMDVGGV